jgi:outer membrane cobalamin receptor
MTSATKAAIFLMLWLASAGNAMAQQAPGDTLGRPVPAQPAETGADTTATEPSFTVERRSVSDLAIGAVLGNEVSVSRRLILELASGSLGEALLVTPGVRLARYGWHGLPQALNLRGAGADEVAYILDDVPFSDPQLEVVDLNWLPVAGVEACELAKGGLSSLLGSGAGAGIVGIRTMTAMPEFPESEIEAWWGSFAGRDVSVRFNRRITGRMGILGTYENMGSGGWIDNSSADTEKFLGKITALLGGTGRVNLTGYRYKGDFQWPDSCPTIPTTYPADRQNERSLLGASVLFGEDRLFSLRCYNLETSESYSSADTNSVEEGRLRGAELDMIWLATDSAATAVGVGFKDRRLSSSSMGVRRSTDYFARALKEVRSGRLRILGSLRLARNSGFGTEAAAGLATRFAMGREMFVFSRLDRNYSFPSFRLMSKLGKDDRADSGIETETSLGFEAGVGLRKGGLSASVSAYWRNTEGSAAWLTDDSCNVYPARSFGLEVIGLEASLGVILEPWFETKIAYGRLHTLEDAGETLAGIPPHTVSLLCRVRRPLSEHISAGITLASRYLATAELGPRLETCGAPAECLSNAELPGQTFAILNFYIDIDRVTTFFKIQNLANDDIRTFWGRPSLPSRSYEFGTSWRLLD